MAHSIRYLPALSLLLLALSSCGGSSNDGANPADASSGGSAGSGATGGAQASDAADGAGGSAAYGGTWGTGNCASDVDCGPGRYCCHQAPDYASCKDQPCNPAPPDAAADSTVGADADADADAALSCDACPSDGSAD